MSAGNRGDADKKAWRNHIQGSSLWGSVTHPCTFYVASLGHGGLSNPFNQLPSLWAASVSLAADLESSKGRTKLGRRAAGKCFPICPSNINSLFAGTTLSLRT